jgi:hypothetical protein
VDEEVFVRFNQAISLNQNHNRLLVLSPVQWKDGSKPEESMSIAERENQFMIIALDLRQHADLSPFAGFEARRDLDFEVFRCARPGDNHTPISNGEMWCRLLVLVARSNSTRARLARRESEPALRGNVIARCCRRAVFSGKSHDHRLAARCGKSDRELCFNDSCIAFMKLNVPDAQRRQSVIIQKRSCTFAAPDGRIRGIH